MIVFHKPPTATRFFYQSGRLCNVMGSSAMRLVMAGEIAIGQKSNAMSALLYQSDCAQSVIGTCSRLEAYSYTPYGGGSIGTAMLLSSFVGQRFDEVSQGYPLGNGVRLYKPRIYRFTSSDELSPFGKGGPNSYAYCQGDPVNRHDPSGQFWILRFLLRSASQATAALVRHLSPITQNLVATVDLVLVETVRDVGRQFAPALRFTRDVITAAAAVPTEQSMRVNALLSRDRTVLPQLPEGTRPHMNRPLVETQTNIRRDQ